MTHSNEDDTTIEIEGDSKNHETVLDLMGETAEVIGVLDEAPE